MDAAAFFLLMGSGAAGAELTADCPVCGAITTQVLELAWRARMVTCGECLASMPLDSKVLSALRRQAADALTAIDRLARDRSYA